MKILMGWKVIAACLEVNEKTLRRNWETWGIPLKILPTKRGYMKPMILKEVLEEWLAGNERVLLRRERRGRGPCAEKGVLNSHEVASSSFEHGGTRVKGHKRKKESPRS